jgi:molecular chaperone DnaK
MGRVVGIDLGTSYTLVAYLERGRPVIIPNSEGDRLTPSVVGFLKDGRTLVGEMAKLQAVANPDGTVFSIKRRMGRRAYLDHDGLDDDREVLRQIKRRMGSPHRVKIADREYTPEEVSALILRKAKTAAETYLGEPVTKAVVTVPAYFNITQRRATMDAGAIAGLEVIRLLDEPTASALAYGLDIEQAHTVLVWDLGGGTFDVSVLELGEGVFQVKAVNGNTWLGGDDFDQRIVDYLVAEFYRDYGVDLRGNKVALVRLKEVAERAKIKLTENKLASIRLPFMDAGQGSPQHWETTLSRAKFEELTADLREQMAGPTRQALADAGIQPGDIDRVLLVGGSTRMPGVQALARELLGHEVYQDIHPDEAVALGAAIQAGILTGEIKGKVLVDVTPLSLGIETEGGIFTKIITRNTTVPLSKGQVFTNASDNQAAMDIHVLQGEREMAVYNMTLDRFQLSGVPPAPRGEARVEVTFTIDANGIVRVGAQDLYSEDSKTVRISPRFYGVAEEELQRMVEEAQRYAAEDHTAREETETNIRARNMIRAATEMVDEASEEAPPDLVQQAEEAILGLRAALAGADFQETETRIKELEKRCKELSGVLFQRFVK